MKKNYIGGKSRKDYNFKIEYQNYNSISNDTDDM